MFSLWGSTPQITPSPGDQGPDLTQCVIGPHKSTCRMTSKSVELFKRGTRMWQTTDHATEKCVGIGGIACAARAIPPRSTCVAVLVNCRAAVDGRCMCIWAERIRTVACCLFCGGCGLNFHKRCAYNVQDNCTHQRERRKSSSTDDVCMQVNKRIRLMLEM